MTTLTVALILLVLLLVLLAGGVWIAISLAAVAWFGLQFFTSTPPDVNLFQSFWGSSASWTLAALTLTALFVGYMAVAVTKFVYESWKFKEVAQGLVKIPIWIPQLCFVFGILIFFIAVVDELVAVLRRQKPAYQVAEEDRRARGDYSEMA